MRWKIILASMAIAILSAILFSLFIKLRDRADKKGKVRKSQLFNIFASLSFLLGVFSLWGIFAPIGLWIWNKIGLSRLF